MPSDNPVLLCFHGGGTSAAIFNAQLRNVKIQLKNDFDFVFVNGPKEGPAGPGVLPFFVDSGPFFWWFHSGESVPPPREGESAAEARTSRALETINECIFTALDEAGRKPTDVAGVLGFSEGTMAATLMLSKASAHFEDPKPEQPPLWPSLHFGIMICGGYRSDVAATIGKKTIRIPSVHAHGLDDPVLPSSRRLLGTFGDRRWARVMEFDGNHHVPTHAGEIQHLTSLIRDADTRGNRLIKYRRGSAKGREMLRRESYSKETTVGVQAIAF